MATGLEKSMAKLMPAIIEIPAQKQVPNPIRDFHRKYNITGSIMTPMAFIFLTLA